MAAMAMALTRPATAHAHRDDARTPRGSEVPPPVLTLDAAEAMLLDFENVLIRLGARDRVSLAAELERLVDIASSEDPKRAATELGRMTGGNRMMEAIDRLDAIMDELAPKLNARWAAAGSERVFAVSCDLLRSETIERYGTDGEDAWGNALGLFRDRRRRVPS